MPTFRPRRSFSIGGVRFRLGRRGVSASSRFGPVTINSSGRASLRTPVGSWLFGGKRGRRRDESAT